MRVIKSVRIEAALFAGMVLFLGSLAVLFRQDPWHISYAPHFVEQDISWLNGRLDVPGWLGHDLVQFGDKYYIVYPPAPALLMLPFVAALGDYFSDIWFGWLAGAANVALLYGVLRALVARGWSARTPRENVIIAVTFGLGTIALWLALGGTVWFVAQTVAITFTLLLLLGVAHENWWLASVSLGGLFLTRSPDVLGGLVVLAAFAQAKLIDRRHPAIGVGSPHAGVDAAIAPDPNAQNTVSLWARFKSSVLGQVSLRSLRMLDLVALAGPVAVAALIWVVRNKLYFGSFFESGYRIQIAQDYPKIQHGMLSWHYLWPNFVANFLNLPSFTFTSPYDLAPKIDLLRGGNGTSIFFTTPLFLAFFFPAPSRLPQWLRVTLWVTVGLLVAVTLAWNLTGWYQVGARYLFDTYPYLFVLLAARGGRISWRWLVLAGWGSMVNLLLAQVFWCQDGACFAHAPHRVAIFTGLVVVSPLMALAAWWWLRRENNKSISPPLNQVVADDVG